MTGTIRIVTHDGRENSVSCHFAKSQIARFRYAES